MWVGAHRLQWGSNTCRTRSCPGMICGRLLRCCSPCRTGTAPGSRNYIFSLGPRQVTAPGFVPACSCTRISRIWVPSHKVRYRPGWWTWMRYGLRLRTPGRRNLTAAAVHMIWTRCFDGVPRSTHPRWYRSPSTTTTTTAAAGHATETVQGHMSAG